MSGGTDGTGLNRSDNRASYVVGVLNELCEHLQQIGIRATVVWDDPSPEAIHYKVEHGTFVILESPLGCVKVEGRSIDAIRVCIESEISWGYDNFDH